MRHQDESIHNNTSNEDETPIVETEINKKSLTSYWSRPHGFEHFKNTKNKPIDSSLHSKLCLFQVALGGCNFTWMNKAGTKMSKLDRFLISHQVIDVFTDVKVTALPRGWSDHTPIMLHCDTVDYGPIPFKFSHSLFQRDGFDECINKAYNECSLINPHMPFHEKMKSKASLSPVAPFASLSQEDNIELEQLVIEEEIRSAVWDCGSQKALGPDGFSFLFLKTYWELLKEDVGKAIRCVFISFVIPKGVTSSVITLIPKIANPIHIKDFRPISLIGMQYKIIAKILANRISKVIHKVVSKELPAFKSRRKILDGTIMLTELMSWYKKKKNMMLFKVDFEKAYDNIREADSVDGRAADSHISSNLTSATNVSEGHEPGSELVPAGDCGFPASAQAFVETIKKNRTYQKFLRDKLIKVEARLEENKKLRERVKFLKGFQVDCRKRTGRALSHKKDPRFQLISVPKLRANASKKKDTRTHPINQGPAQNPQVAIYKEAMLKYSVSLSREPWSKVDNENLKKGIKQQIQEMMMQNLFSAEDPNSSNLDRMITRIKKREITPEEIRSFLPKVNWEQLASMYLTGRSGPECESRWRNCEDPLINRGQWTNVEEKKMLHCFSNRGFSNWIDIAKELKTNRTPYQCLARFQRSLNPSILNKEWTPTEDEELRKAVAEYGETNWQLVASVLPGRTGTQCSNRWKRSLNPLRARVGRWDSDEDKRLKIAVRLFGAKNWNKITKFVPGRTQVQCRERWVNCLDPSLKVDKWTEEEDMKLKAAIEEHNHCWARVAACIPPRTDSQCRRRWMVLLPHQALVLKAAKEIEKRCFVSNFVDREEERPQLTYKDFNKPLLLESGPKANEDNIISKDKKRRTVGKDRPRRAKKVAHARKARKLVDEDDLEDNDGQADVTSNGDGENSEVEKEATGSIKVWTRRARQVTRTTKVLKLIDEDVGEDNDGHGDITSNGGLTQQSLKNKANTSLKDAGLLEHDNGERIRTFDGDNCKIKKKPTRKRKQKQRYDFVARFKRKETKTGSPKKSVENTSSNVQIQKVEHVGSTQTKKTYASTLHGDGGSNVERQEMKKKHVILSD
nr:myb domain protein 4r1 [Tanacetum cinerariifolium]